MYVVMKKQMNLGIYNMSLSGRGEGVLILFMCAKGRLEFFLKSPISIKSDCSIILYCGGTPLNKTQHDLM